MGPIGYFFDNAARADARSPNYEVHCLFIVQTRRRLFFVDKGYGDCGPIGKVVVAAPGSATAIVLSTESATPLPVVVELVSVAISAVCLPASSRRHFREDESPLSAKTMMDRRRPCQMCPLPKSQTFFFNFQF